MEILFFLLFLTIPIVVVISAVREWWTLPRWTVERVNSLTD